MVKNSMGGKKAKKMKNSGPVKKATIYAGEDQTYAIVNKCHSHSNIEIYYVDRDDYGTESVEFGIGVMRGKIIKRIKRINIGDIFIVSKRDFETVKYGSKPKLDIIHKYNDNERHIIIPLLNDKLKVYIDSQSDKLDASNEESIKLNEEIMFEDSNTKTTKKYRNKKINLNNTISTSYLDSVDLPPLSDEED
jgi:hypothetical protein